MSKIHYNELDICKGIAITSVLLSHSFIHHPIELCDIEWCKYCLDIIGSFFLPLFFIISGFLFSFSKYDGFLNNLKRKALRLMLPYVSYGVINFALKLLFPELINRKMDSIFDYIINYLFYGGELWFVYVLFIIFALMPPIVNRINSNKGYLLFGIILILLWQFLPGEFYNGIFLYPKVVKYALFFLLGYRFSLLYREKLDNTQILVYLGFIFFVLNIVFVQELQIGVVLISLILACIGSFFFWSLSFKIENLDQLAKYLTFVGKYSLAFYFFNGFALVPARIIVVKVLSITSPMAIVPIVFILCMLGCSVGVLIARKFPRISKLVGI